MLLNIGAVSTACRIDRIEFVVHNLKIIIVKHTILNLLSLSLRLYDACKVRLLRTVSKAFPGKYYPERAGDFSGKLRMVLHVREPQYLCRVKGKESDDWQVQECLTRILRDNGSILL